MEIHIVLKEPLPLQFSLFRELAGGLWSFILRSYLNFAPLYTSWRRTHMETIRVFLSLLFPGGTTKRYLLNLSKNNVGYRHKKPVFLFILFIFYGQKTFVIKLCIQCLLQHISNLPLLRSFPQIQFVFFNIFIVECSAAESSKILRTPNSWTLGLLST